MKISMAPPSKHLYHASDLFDHADLWQKAYGQLSKRDYPRKELANALKEYNLSIGNDAAALKNIDTLRQEDSACIVTGQQLGLMGGPAYTIWKAISCLLAAKEANAIPIFWMATEDHDTAEIDHTYLLDPFGNLQKFQFALPKDGRPVEDLMLSPKNLEELRRFATAVDLQGHLDSFVAPSYAQTMARVMAFLFSGTGLIFLEPKLLRPLAKGFWRNHIENNDEIQHVLKSTTRTLVEAGGTTVLNFEAGTNLFMKTKEGLRLRVYRDKDVFVWGYERLNTSELVSQLEKYPERFSANAAARPVLQSALIPTLAYVGGPSEVAYYRQLGDYHRFHNVPIPLVIPRISATLISPSAADILEKSSLNPWDDLPHHWKGILPKLYADGEAMESEWLISASRFFSGEASDDLLMRFIKLGSRKLLHKVEKVRLRHRGLPRYGLHLLRNLIHPHDKPQERTLNWWAFQKQTKSNLMMECLNVLNWRPGERRYIYF